MNLKNNNMKVLLLFILTASCSRSGDYPNLLSHLERRASTDKLTLNRELAAEKSACFQDLFSLDQVKAEIANLEKKYRSGSKVDGTWKHLRLNDLPIPQANLLKKYGNQLGYLNEPDRIDYSSCKDVPCIFNKIYADSDEIAGYVHYLWYLKTGSYLAATNTVHNSSTPLTPGLYNGKSIAISSYLYRPKEIYAFWRLLKMMSVPHPALNGIVIHRVPQGNRFEFEEAKGPNTGQGETCGLAWNSGYIVLQDLCLTVYPNKDEGSFYASVAHEISHQIDYFEGQKLGRVYRSDKQDYLDIAKFKLVEYKNDKGETVRQWTLLPGMKSVSAYGKTSPAESFAETLAHFRIMGTHTKGAITDEHWNFTSNNYFGGKKFDQESIIKSWLTQDAAFISQMSFKAVAECEKPSQPRASTFFKNSDFAVPVMPSVLNCLGYKGSEISNQVLKKVKLREPDGCDIMDEESSEKDWNTYSKNAIAAMMNKYLKEVQADPQYFARVQTFIGNIANSDMANAAYLGCPNTSEEENCYSDAVIQLASTKLKKLSIPDYQIEELANLYLSSHPFSETKSYITMYYRSFIASNKSAIDQEAIQLYNQCQNEVISDTASPVGTYFTISDGYMVSSLYNCLNSRFPETVKWIVKKLAVDEMQVQHPKEESIFTLEVSPELRRSLMAIYKLKKAKEAKSLVEYLGNEGGALRREILSNFSWVKSDISGKTSLQECVKLALSKVPFPLRYQTRGDAFGDLAQRACANYQVTSEYNSWLENSKTVFADRTVTGLEEKILELAMIRSETCIAKYPMDNNLNRIKFKVEREACLIDEWPRLEGTAISLFEQDPLVIKFKVDVNAVKSQLDLSRRRLQLKVLKEFL